MLALRNVIGRRLAPFFALVLSMGGVFVAVHAGTAAAADCTASSPDVDLDHVPDCWEATNGLVVGRRDAGTDKDRDGLPAKIEYSVDKAFSGTGPLVDVYNAALDDTNHNGVEDGDEDLDGDGLTNENEKEAHANLLDSDTDNDGIEDGVDDTDHDGIDNEDEGNSVDEDGDIVGVDDLTDNNSDGLNDSNQDFDCDGVANRNELNAANPNSDHKGTGDAIDDSDSDGVSNGTEANVGDDPIDVDSDDDGIQDGNDDSDGDQIQDGDEDGSPDDGQGDVNDSTCSAGDVEDGL